MPTLAILSIDESTRDIIPLEDMAPAPRLSLDIIHVIISFLGKRELSRFSLICKLYRRPALRQLLSFPVYIFENTKLVRFCACVLADVTVRAPWIRNLDLHWAAFQWNDDMDNCEDATTAVITDRTSVSILAVVLEHCHGLTTLRVPFLGKLLSACPQLGTSIASLQGLTELYLFLTDDSPQIREVLCDMQSRLHILRLHYHDAWEYPTFPLHDPTAFASTANIEVLDLTNVTFMTNGTQRSPWRSVRQVKMCTCITDMDALPSVFPNLQTCKLDSGVVFEPRQVESHLWHDLDVLEVDSAIVTGLLRWKGCPIRRLELHTTFNIPFAEPDEAHEIIDLLRESQPLVLSIRQVDAQVGLHFWRTLQEVSPNLRCLELEIVPSQISDWIAYLNCLLPFLANLPIIYLAINVARCPTIHGTQNAPLDHSFPSYVIQTFARKIRSLQYLAVRSHIYPHEMYDWWRIIRSQSPDSQPRLKLLSHSKGKKVQKYLWAMDRESLLNFNIDKFIGRS